MPTSDGLTVRISNLPPEADPRGNDVRRFFDSRVGPTKRRTKQTTVTFISHDIKKKALERCDRTTYSAEHGNGSIIVNVEDEFIGLMTLYMPESGTSNLDREGIKETCWLRDELPSFLEGQGKGIRPRVMNFGYHANIWINNTADGFDTPVSDLIHSLKVVREVVDEMITPNKQTNPDYVTPIKACLFRAVPHRGTGNANELALFLTALKKVLLPALGPNKKYVKDLELKNKKLADITDRFIQLLNGNKIQVISCYENRDYVPGKGKIVSKQSATLDYAGREQLPRPIDGNHSNVARFGGTSQHPFVEIASELADIGCAAFEDLSRRFSTLGIENSRLLGAGHSTSIQNIPGSSITVEPRQLGEPEFFKLTRYITVFLVDDSTSMENVPESGISLWSDATKCLAECAALILGARGRLKVLFFKSPKSKENILKVAELRELCRFIPRGDTPTYQRLKRHLDEFMEDFTPLNAKQRGTHPGLNVIIFTDGAPVEPFEEIEEVIVDRTKDLDGLRAGKYKIVDTTRYDPTTADISVYKKIVFGAFDKARDGKGSANVQGSSNDTQAPYPSRLAVAQVFSNQVQYQCPSARVGGPTSRGNTR
ncbi:hypothetical protein OEA41_010683 [Lepraria neglecta]|uniref:VWFA domain-containing protein n=1 Tax=Lepraria neglecta TaxID=209136 RepID=A0AAD9YYB2_9LECA|nr:hypothetical protein OEA41_010683 [Lepraria neglecta]